LLASPFPLGAAPVVVPWVPPAVLPPQPAASAATSTSSQRSSVRIRIDGASLSNTIDRVEAPTAIHHVGVAVEDLDAAVATYERLFGARLEHRSRVEEQGVEAASLRVGESRVELLGALGDDTPVGRFLAKRGPGMHHVAYEVGDIRAALRGLAEAGAELIDETPRRGMFGLEVAFVHPDSVHGVLSEVVSNG
jgi:methylmalonyl-CoA epimerase